MGRGPHVLLAKAQALERQASALDGQVHSCSWLGGGLFGRGGAAAAADKRAAARKLRERARGVVEKRRMAEDASGRVGRKCVDSGATNSFRERGAARGVVGQGHKGPDQGEISREELLLDPLPVMVEGDGFGGGGDVSVEEMEAVKAVAGGRVWSGEEALDVGLVDALGGIQTAIDLV